MSTRAIDPALDRALALGCWHLVAHRSELARDRDFVRLEWVLGEIALFNDRGRIVAFDNVCPHRGGRFFEGAGGNAPAVCPYHGWSYRGGALRVARPEGFRACDLERARLNRFAVAECGDFIFVGVAPAQELRAQLGGLFEVLAGMSGDIEGCRAAEWYDYKCPWRIAVENALEPDHVHMVHKDTLGLLRLGTGRNAYHGWNSVLRAPIGDERTVRRLERVGRLFDVKAAEPGYTAIHLFPFGFLTSTYGYTYSLQTFMPGRDAGRTRFGTRLFAARVSGAGAAAAVEPYFASVAAMNRTVFEEDHEICRRVNPEFPLGGAGEILSATEEKVGHFRASVASASGVRAVAA